MAKDKKAATPNPTPAGASIFSNTKFLPMRITKIGQFRTFPNLEPFTDVVDAIEWAKQQRPASEGEMVTVIQVFEYAA